MAELVLYRWNGKSQFAIEHLGGSREPQLAREEKRVRIPDRLASATMDEIIALVGSGAIPVAV